MKDYTITKIGPIIWKAGFNAYFKVDDREYYAYIVHLSFPPYTPECMIFPSKDGEFQ